MVSEEDPGSHQGFSEAYPDEEYAYPKEAATDSRETDPEEYSYYDEFGYDYEADYESDGELEGSLEGEPGEVSQSSDEELYGYDDAEPYDEYGYDCYGERVEQADEWIESSGDDYCEWTEAEHATAWESESEYVPESGLELFAWHPTELLLLADQEVLRTLETLCEEPSGVRRATLNDYLEILGWEAIDFASRFEDVTGVEVLGLADDLPGAAAFLGAFRLVEQGELGTDEAVDLLRRSLESLSLDWIEGVGEITADAFEDWDPQPASTEMGSPGWSEAASPDSPVVHMMVSLATRSLADLGAAISGISRRFAELDLQSVEADAAEGRAAAHVGPSDDYLQR